MCWLLSAQVERGLVLAGTQVVCQSVIIEEKNDEKLKRTSMHSLQIELHDGSHASAGATQVEISVI